MAYIEKREKKNGKTSYRALVRMKGFPTESATFERKTDATKWAQQTEAAMREGRYFKTSEARRHTFGDLIDRYIVDVLPDKPKSQAQQSQQLMWWKGHLGDYNLSDITPALIAEYRDKLAKEKTHFGKGKSPATVARYLAALSHAFTIAVKEWGWLNDSPTSKVSKPKEPRGRVRFLSDDERERLLDACRESDNPLLYTIVVLALSTGARKMEIMNLRWGDVDFQRKMIVIHDTKNGDRRSLPLTGHAFDLIKRMSTLRRIDTDLLFNSYRNALQPMTIRGHWCKALDEAKVSDFTFHDLRHSAASYLAMNGASLAEIAEVLGHRSFDMVKRYAHLSEQHTVNVVTKMNKAVFGK